MALKSTQVIRDRLHKLAVREKALIVYTGAARVLISLVLFAAVFILLDYLLSIPRVLRLCLLVGGAGAILWIAKTYLRDPLRLLLDEEAVALRLEARFPHLRDRLISIVQLTRSEEDMARAGMSTDLLRRLERDTAGVTSSLNFSEIIDWGFIKKVSLVCAVLVFASVIGASRFPSYVMTGLVRMGLGNKSYPRLTGIQTLDPVKKIVRGDDWHLRAEVVGRIPYAVTLYTRPADGSKRWEAAEMPSELGRTYAITIQKVQESFAYTIEAGDARTSPEEVIVLVPVALEDPLVRVIPPAYTGLSPIHDASLREVEVPERSEVEFIVPATKRVVSGQIFPEGGDPIDLTPLPSGKGASGKLVVTDSMSFFVSVVDGDGLANPEPRAMYRLKVRPDYPPRAAIISPREDRTSVPIAEWTIRYRLSDDFGVKQAWLAWRIDVPRENGNGEMSGEEDLSEIVPVRAGRDEIPVPAGDRAGDIALSMLSKKAAVGDVLTIWVEAADALAGMPGSNGEGNAHMGRSPFVRFKIISAEEKWAEIDAKMKDAENEIIEIYDGEKKLKSAIDRTGETMGGAEGE